MIGPDLGDLSLIVIIRILYEIENLKFIKQLGKSSESIEYGFYCADYYVVYLNECLG